ncbi:MAG: 3'(2'),5'-bisphosphate nucleotidase CysQ [Candidatus Rifleibacteriota bacterium]
MIRNLPFNYPDAAYVIGVALSAAEKIKEIYAKDFDFEMKAGNEPVTIADKEADLIITKELRKKFPKDKIFSEENGLDKPDGCNTRTWYIDPIDGTREFIKKNGEFAIQIGLADGEDLEFGLIYQPVGENLYIGAKGQGCWWLAPGKDWRRLRVPEKQNDEAILIISRSHPSKIGQKIHDAIGGTGIISHGGVGLKLMAIAHGRGHYYINCSNATKAWDLAGPELLFIEAGGVVSQLDGSGFSYEPDCYRHNNGLLASCNQEMHEKILEAVKDIIQL